MERREFVRVRMAVPIRYKFVRLDGTKLLDDLFEGSSLNVSSGGLLLEGRLPDPAWIPRLLAREAYVAINLAIPGDPAPIKALARVAWVEQLAEDRTTFPMGLCFEAIEPDAKSRIQRYVIRAQIG